MYRMNSLFSAFQMSLIYFVSCNCVNNTEQNPKEGKKKEEWTYNTQQHTLYVKLSGCTTAYIVIFDSLKNGKMLLTGVVQAKSCSPDRKKILHGKL